MFKKRHPNPGARPGTLHVSETAPPPKIRLVHYSEETVHTEEIEQSLGLPLPLGGALSPVLELFDPTLQFVGTALCRGNLLRQVNETLVFNHTLDTLQSALKLGELDQDRILGGRR